MFKRHLPLAIVTLLALLAVLAASVRADTINTVAGDGTPQRIGQPFGVEVGPDGALYICEVESHRVTRLDRETGKLRIVVGSGEKGYAGDGGAATDAKLNEPYEVRFDDAGNMFFVEMRNHLVRRVDGKTGVVSTIAGTGEQGFGGDGGSATKAKLKQPHSIALDTKRGHLYIADIGNHRIRRVDLKTGVIDTVAGNGQRTLPREGKMSDGEPMLGPRALFIHERTLWIALREGHSVWRMNLDTQQLSHVAGTGKKGYDDGAAKSATFNGPKGIAVGPGGNVFVVDTENQTIRVIDVKANSVSTLAGVGPQGRGYGGDNGPATKAKMDRPHGVCVDDVGRVYIGDSNNHRVRVVVPAKDGARGASGATGERKTTIDIRPVADGWGEAQPATVKKLLESVAGEFAPLFPDVDLPPIVVRPRGGPIVLFRRGKNGEILMHLNTGDLFWSQYSYQFSHELGHILFKYDADPHGNDWFEESLCELASLYVLRRMGETWKTRPPFAHWKSYAKHFTAYAQKRIDAHALPQDQSLATWYAAHAKELHGSATKRKLNTTIAVALLPLFEKQPEHWAAAAYLNAATPKAAAAYLNAATPKAAQTFEAHLRDWHTHCPQKHQAFVVEVAEKFGVTFEE